MERSLQLSRYDTDEQWYGVLLNRSDMAEWGPARHKSGVRLVWAGTHKLELRSQ